MEIMSIIRGSIGAMPSSTGYLSRRIDVCLRVNLSMCVCFITAGPITKLFARAGGGNGGHVQRETTSRGRCELVCPSRTNDDDAFFLFLQKQKIERRGEIEVDP